MAYVGSLPWWTLRCQIELLEATPKQLRIPQQHSSRLAHARNLRSLVHPWMHRCPRARRVSRRSECEGDRVLTSKPLSMSSCAD